MPVKCFELDTCTVQGLGHHTDFNFVGGRWSVTGKFIFLISFIHCRAGGLCFSGCSVHKLACPISTSESKCFCGVFVAKGVPVCARLMGSAQAL